MVKNSEVCLDFVGGYESKTGNLFSEKDNFERLVLFSYGRHFPLAIKLNNGEFILNSSGYSQTTAKHKGDLARALGFENFKDLLENHDDKIILKNCGETQNLIHRDFKSIGELIENEI